MRLTCGREEKLVRNNDRDDASRSRELSRRRYNRKSFQNSSARISARGENVRFAIVVLAILGMVVSGLALKVHYDDAGKEPCSINDKWDCGVVNHSPYAMMHGVPVAAIGIGGYILIAVLAFLRRRGLLLLFVLIGLAFALYLTNIEAHVLEVYCLYCVISQGIIALITLLSMVWIALARRQQATA
jgi:vitamin-K-epoxide reductase (warfarin-sensitive)